MDHVFISYSRHDADFAGQLVGAIQRHGARSAWIDERNIPVSVPWLTEIEDAIRSAAVVVVVNSSSWARSQNCQIELEMARRLRQPVVYVEVAIDSVAAAVESIEAALTSRPSWARSRGELLLRSAQWLRMNRPSAQLATGAALKSYRQVAREATAQLPPDAIEYLAASNSRRRRKRWVGFAGGATATALVVSIYVMVEVQKEVDERFAESNAGLTLQAQTEELFDFSVYAALDAASSAELDAAHERSFDTRRRLIDALAVAVPDEFRAASDAEWESVSADPRHAQAATGGWAATADDKRGQVVISTPADPAAYRLIPTSSIVTALSWSHSGHFLAAATARGIEIINARDGVVADVLQGDVGEVVDIEWSDDDTRVSVVTSGKRFAGWSLGTGALVLDDPGWWFMGMAYADGVDLAAAISRDGRVALVDAARTEISDVIQTDGDGVANSIAAWGDQLVVGKVSADGRDRMVLVDIRTHAQRVVELAGCDITGLDVAPETEQVLIACDSDGFGVYDIQAETLEVYATDASVVSIDHAAGLILAGDPYGRIMRLSPGAGSSVDLNNDTECVSGAKAVAIAPVGGPVFYAGAGSGITGCSKVGVLDATGTGVATWNVLLFPRQVAEEARALAVSVHDHAAFGFSDGSIWTVDADNNERFIRRGLSGAVRGLAYTPGGDALVAATRNGQLAVYSTAMDLMTVAELGSVASERIAWAEQVGLYRPFS